MVLDCLVIGAGQSGLSCADQLQAAGLNYLVVDRHRHVGDTWRERPRNLHLFTSRQFCQLGSVPMPGEQGGFPSGAEFGDYLDLFAITRRLQVRMECPVRELTCAGGVFVASLENGSQLRARTVIDATGSSQLAKIPPLAGELGGEVAQLTAANYRDPDSVAPGSVVMVVGDGASGRQIAMELAASHKVILSTGRKRKLVPNVVMGRDLFWWLTKIGVVYAPTNSVVAKVLRKRDPIPAKDFNNEKLRLAGVDVRPRAVRAEGKTVWFKDESTAGIDTVVWCGGYKEDVSWYQLPKLSITDDHVDHVRGFTSQPGFYVMGRKWLSCRASELVLGATKDASIVVGHVLTQMRASSGAPAPAKIGINHV